VAIVVACLDPHPGIVGIVEAIGIVLIPKKFVAISTPWMTWLAQAPAWSAYGKPAV